MSEQLFFDDTPIVGWRAWVLAEDLEGPELRSVVYQHVWPARNALSMECEPGGCLGARWPAQTHACGIHAFKERAGAARFPATWESRRAEGAGVSTYVIGQVSLWGHVIEHEHGFRGQFAYPYALCLPPGRRHLASPLARRYGVEVVVEAP
ncbi:MAG: hypothetical protein M3P41_15495 [Actinomycetota bacterium]|nr:hypothetical protein [Actinomycetota bacterium]